MLCFNMWGNFDFVQDQGLDVIAEGLGTLKDMAHDMNEVSFIPFLNHWWCKITGTEYYPWQLNVIIRNLFCSGIG